MYYATRKLKTLLKLSQSATGGQPCTAQPQTAASLDRCRSDAHSDGQPDGRGARRCIDAGKAPSDDWPTHLERVTRGPPFGPREPLANHPGTRLERGAPRGKELAAILNATAVRIRVQKGFLEGTRAQSVAPVLRGGPRAAAAWKLEQHERT